MKTHTEHPDPKNPVNTSDNGYDEFSMGNDKYEDRFEDNENDEEQYDGKEHPLVEDEKDTDDEEAKDNDTSVKPRSSSSGKPTRKR